MTSHNLYAPVLSLLGHWQIGGLSKCAGESQSASLKELGQGYVDGMPTPQSAVARWFPQFGWWYVVGHYHATVKHL